MSRKKKRKRQDRFVKCVNVQVILKTLKWSEVKQSNHKILCRIKNDAQKLYKKEVTTTIIIIHL